MFEEVISAIKSIIYQKYDSSIAPIFGNGYKVFNFSKDNFKEISDSSNLNRIAFIDGGNSEIVGNAAFSLNALRCSCVVFESKKRKRSELSELLCLSRSLVENESVKFELSFYPVKGHIIMDKLSFMNSDETLKNGVNNAEIISTANAARRLLELSMAKKAADDKIADIIIIDGNLQCTLTHEKKFMDKLHESCEKSGVILGALSKNSQVLSSKNSPFTSVLLKSKQGPWFYHPVANSNLENHQAEIYFINMHAKSRHAFRFEIFSNQKQHSESAIALLSNYCKDPIFLGYPYGLIEADRMARITNIEKQSLKNSIIERLGKNADDMAFSNAHSILDRISF